jgi:hypothetical protein
MTLSGIAKTLIGLALLCSAAPILFVLATGAGFAATVPWLSQVAVELGYTSALLAVIGGAVTLFKFWQTKRTQKRKLQ